MSLISAGSISLDSAFNVNKNASTEDDKIRKCPSPSGTKNPQALSFISFHSARALRREAQYKH
jgi:hypothetical protein